MKMIKTFFALACLLLSLASIAAAQEEAPTTTFWQLGKVYVVRTQVKRGYWTTTKYFISKDGVTFERAKDEDSSDEGATTVIAFLVPATQQRGTFRFTGDELAVDGKPFRRVTLNPARMQFMPFPDVRYIREILQASNGEYVVVSDGQYAEGYDGIRLFVGSAANMREVKVTDSSFTRCGAFSLETVRGSFDYHTPDATEPSTFDGDRLRHLDSDDFTIIEKGATAVLKPKTKK